MHRRARPLIAIVAALTLTATLAACGSSDDKSSSSSGSGGKTTTVGKLARVLVAEETSDLDLAESAAHFLPLFLASDHYRQLLEGTDA